MKAPKTMPHTDGDLPHLTAPDVRRALAGASPLNRRNAGAAIECKICGGHTVVFDVVDANKITSVSDYYAFGLSGFSVVYLRCQFCGFVFTCDFDDWSDQDFVRHIYNADYPQIDPDYLFRRPTQIAAVIARALGTRKHLRILDYGSGEGVFVEAMRRAGFSHVQGYDPYSSPARPRGLFDLVTAFEVVEHVVRPIDTFREIASFLVPGGLACVQTSIQPDNIATIRGAWWYIAPRNGHLSIYTLPALSAVGQSAGMRLHIGAAQQTVFSDIRGSFDDDLMAAVCHGQPRAYPSIELPATERQRGHHGAPNASLMSKISHSKSAKMFPDLNRSETAPPDFRQAVAAFEQRNVDQAAALCVRILRDRPEHGDALHLSGVIAMHRGDASAAVHYLTAAATVTPTDALLLSNLGSALEASGDYAAAIEAYDRALLSQPGHVVAHFNRGNALKAVRRFEEAVASYEAAIRLRPDYPEAHANRAIALHEAGYPLEAMTGYDHALALRPDHAPTHHNRARALQLLNQIDAALASYDRAVLLSPADATIHCDRAILLKELSYPEAALVSLDQAITHEPAHFEAHINRAFCLLLLERWGLALDAFDHAIALRGDAAAAWSGRGIALRGLGRLSEARASLDRALALQPDSPESHLNYGNVLLGLQEPEAALECFDRALHFRPDYADGLLDRGVALQELLRLEEAVSDFDRALAINSNWPEAGMNKAIALALAGRLGEAWIWYQARKRRRSPSGVRLSPGVSARPLWTGMEPVAGKRVFIYWEQGFGDTIQFCRYAPMVRDLGAEVILSVPDPLLPLLRGAFPGVWVLGGNEEPRDFDLHCPLLDLPRAFGTVLETIPAEKAYLDADPQRIAVWADRLGKRTNPRIGLAWSGRADHVSDAKRSMRLEMLAPLLTYQAEWIALQKEIRQTDTAAAIAEQRLRLFCEDLHDYAETAALIAQLDLVICVDTSVAHLAAAMGKPVWLMISRCPDWRWMVGRDDSPWYPTIRLFRQPATNDWSSVIRAVSDELVQLPFSV